MPPVRGLRSLLIAAVAGVLAVAATCMAGWSALAAELDGPRPESCYALSDDQLALGTLSGAREEGAAAYWGAWADALRVPCTRPHTFEVTEVGPIPADADAFEFAAEQCTALGVWTSAGVNRTRAGIVRAPLRVEPRAFAVRSATPSYACGAVAVGLDEPGAARAFVSLSSRLRDLSTLQRAALRYCTVGAREPDPRTVDCATRPRWQVEQWVLWTAFFDTYPGRSVLRARAAALCGPGASPTVPRAVDWATGMPLTWCFGKTDPT
jgi:hypothetical protein